MYFDYGTDFATFTSTSRIYLEYLKKTYSQLAKVDRNIDVYLLKLKGFTYCRIARMYEIDSKTVRYIYLTADERIKLYVQKKAFELNIIKDEDISSRF